MVSHDRAFMDNVTDRLLVLKGDGLVRLFDGSYSEYLAMMDEEAEAARAEAQVGSGLSVLYSHVPKIIKWGMHCWTSAKAL